MVRVCEENIRYPDTVLQLNCGVGIENYAAGNDFSLSQNVPNPFDGTTTVNLQLDYADNVHFSVFDVNGKNIIDKNMFLDADFYTFRLTLATPQTYFLSVKTSRNEETIKMVNLKSGGDNRIELVGKKDVQNACDLKSAKSESENPFEIGDMMYYIGLATINGVYSVSSTIMQAQTASQLIELQFNVNILPDDGQPCYDASTVTDVDGNVYNTVLIGQQCWMKENLRTTKYADNTSISMGGNNTSSTTAYIYYPNNNADNVADYGYLYNWPAVMGTSSSSSANPSGVQGICPDGWHVPSDAEWTQLTSYVKSKPEYVSDNCYGQDGSNGTYCIAKALASTMGWRSSENTSAPGYVPSSNDATGFSIVPAGNYDESYYGFSENACFWASNFYDNGDFDFVYYRSIGYNDSSIGRSGYRRSAGYSVRCVKDLF